MLDVYAQDMNMQPVRTCQVEREGACMSNEKKSTVLLIEPDPVLRRLIVLGLEHRGMHVIEAKSATSMASFEGHQLDLLVLDLDGSVGHQRSFLAEAHSLLAHPRFS